MYAMQIRGSYNCWIVIIISITRRVYCWPWEDGSAFYFSFFSNWSHLFIYFCPVMVVMGCDLITNRLLLSHSNGTTTTELLCQSLWPYLEVLLYFNNHESNQVELWTYLLKWASLGFPRRRSLGSLSCTALFWRPPLVWQLWAWIRRWDQVDGVGL